MGKEVVNSRTTSDVADELCQGKIYIYPRLVAVQSLRSCGLHYIELTVGGRYGVPVHGKH
jgi:hypothetical protein